MSGPTTNTTTSGVTSNTSIFPLPNQPVTKETIPNVVNNALNSTTTTTHNIEENIYTNKSTNLSPNIENSGKALEGPRIQINGAMRTITINGQETEMTASMCGKDVILSDKQWLIIAQQVEGVFIRTIVQNNKTTFKTAELTLKKTSNNFEFASSKINYNDECSKNYTKDDFEKINTSNKSILQNELNKLGKNIEKSYTKTSTVKNPTLHSDKLASIHLKEPRKIDLAIKQAQTHYNTLSATRKPSGNLFHQIATQIQNLPKIQGRDLKYSKNLFEIDLESGLKKEYANDFTNDKNKQKNIENKKFAAIYNDLKNIYKEDKTKLEQIRLDHYNNKLFDKLDITELELRDVLCKDKAISNIQKEKLIKLYAYYIQDGGDKINEALFLDAFLEKHPEGFQYAIVESNGNVSKCSNNHFTKEDCLFYQKPRPQPIVSDLDEEDTNDVESSDDSTSVDHSKLDLRTPPTPIKNRITVKYDTGFGNSLYIKGNASGMNNFEKSFPLTKLEGDHNTWFLELTQPHQSFEYALFLDKKGDKTPICDLTGRRTYNPKESANPTINDMKVFGV